MWTCLINRSFHSAGTILIGQRPTVRAFSRAADVGGLMRWRWLGASVSSGLCWSVWWAVSSLMHVFTHAHTGLLNPARNNQIQTSPPHPALMEHHQDNSAPIPLFSSCHFIPYSEGPVFSVQNVSRKPRTAWLTSMEMRKLHPQRRHHTDGSSTLTRGVYKRRL